MGIGDWGLGIGDWGLGPIPNPQSPNYYCILNKKYFIKNILIFSILIKFYILLNIIIYSILNFIILILLIKLC